MTFNDYFTDIMAINKTSTPEKKVTKLKLPLQKKKKKKKRNILTGF